MKKNLKEVNILTKWDMDCGNITYKKDDETFNIKISGGFNNWDAISKLDYLSDLSTWIQFKVDEIHNNLSPKETNVLVNLMGVIPPTMKINNLR
jgi:hypothetical protein